MAVFARKGPDAVVIDDFVAEAGVARGTFYNYFRTTEELLDGVTAELSDVVSLSIEEVVLKIPDPLERLTCGCLLYMHIGIDMPNWGAFVMRTGFRSRSIGKMVDSTIPRDLAAAQASGGVRFVSLRAARDLMWACIKQGIQSVLAGEAPREHLRQLVGMALLGLEVHPERAAALCAMALPHVDLPQGFNWEQDSARKPS